MDYCNDSPIIHADLAAFLAFEDTVDSAESIEYGSDIAAFMKLIEAKTLPENPNYMDSQPELSFRMRKTLIVWLVEVHNEYDLRQETLFLAINILDRFCAKRLVPRAQYQLLGITALWIAAKYEENHGRVPSLRMLCYICCQNYREKDLVAMEGVVLRELGFELGHATVEAFLKATVRLVGDREEARVKQQRDCYDSASAPVSAASSVSSYPPTPTTTTFHDFPLSYPTFGFYGTAFPFVAGPTEDDAYRAYADSCAAQYTAGQTAFSSHKAFHSLTPTTNGYLGSTPGYLGTRHYDTEPALIITPESRAVARYLLEISTVHARYHRFKPSTLATAALSLAEHILNDGSLIAPSEDDEDVVGRCEAFLSDCLSDPPKQIFAKYAGGKFLRASMVAERWIKRQSVMRDSPVTPSPIAVAVAGLRIATTRRGVRRVAVEVWNEAEAAAAALM